MSGAAPPARLPVVEVHPSIFVRAGLAATAGFFLLLASVPATEGPRVAALPPLLVAVAMLAVWPPRVLVLPHGIAVRRWGRTRAMRWEDVREGVTVHKLNILRLPPRVFAALAVGRGHSSGTLVLFDEGRRHALRVPLTDLPKRSRRVVLAAVRERAPQARTRFQAVLERLPPPP